MSEENKEQVSASEKTSQNEKVQDLRKKNRKYEVAIYEGHMINRLKAFTDCILSIIATLMVLSFPTLKGPVTKLSDLSVLISPLIIYVVSFLVIMSFYFESIKLLGKIHKITGWQIFAYSIFLMMVALFPVLTKFETDLNSNILLVIYILYIYGVSRLHDTFIARVLAFNHEENFQHNRFLILGLYGTFIVSIALGILGFSAYSGFILVLIPLRSLVKSVVIK